MLLAMLNFLLLSGLAVTVFGLPLQGSFATLAAGALLYVSAATAIGLCISAFMRSRIAALFGTTVLTIRPRSPRRPSRLDDDRDKAYFDPKRDGNQGATSPS